MVEGSGLGGSGGVAPAWRRLGLGVLSQVVSPGLVDEAVAVTGRGQQRVRLLPARVVVLFVLALVVFSTQGYRQVWRELVSGWPALAWVTPSRSAFSKARQRLGAAPLAWLFTRVRGCQGGVGLSGVFRFGLRVVAWDGTKVQVPDSAANAVGFGRDAGGGTVGGFPRVRLVALVECGTRAVIDAAFGRESEQVLAGRLVGALGSGMLLLADRNFAGYQLWAAVRARGAHVMWRLGAHRVLPILRRLPDGSWLSQLSPPAAARKQGASPILVRVLRYRITVTSRHPDGTMVIKTETVRLVTSLLDPAHTPARALAATYHERWEIENGFRELKVWLRGPSVILRSHDPDGVAQELWAHLIVYQALRHLITTAAAEVRIDPDRLSILTCLRTARRKITNLAIVCAPDLAAAITAVIDELLDDQIPPRRDRVTPRVVKRPVKSYRAKQPGMSSTNVSYHIDLQPPKIKESA